MSPQKAQAPMVVGYEVVVRGQFQSASGKDRILKNFGPVTFFLPEYVEIPNGRKFVKKTVDGKIVQTSEAQVAKKAVTEGNVALWVVQRRLLPTWLAENHPDCVSFRTCQIVPGSMKRVQRSANSVPALDKPVQQMSMQELKEFCKRKSLSVPVSAFKDVAEAREAVESELAFLDPKKTQAIANHENAADTTDTDNPSSQEVEDAPEGVKASHGEVTSDDEVPTDEEDPAAALI